MFGYKMFSSKLNILHIKYFFNGHYKEEKKMRQKGDCKIVVIIIVILVEWCQWSNCYGEKSGGKVLDSGGGWNS